MNDILEKSPKQDFIYGWCRTDHKDGNEIRAHFPRPDYINDPKYKADTIDLLARAGLPAPYENQVFRGTSHDMLFIESHGVIARIGPPPSADFLHPAILQPLGVVQAPDSSLAITLYPGIELLRYYDQAGGRRQYRRAHPLQGQLYNLMEATDQTAKDLSRENIGIIRMHRQGREIAVPILLDPDEKYDYASFDRQQSRSNIMAQSTEKDKAAPLIIKRALYDVYSDQSAVLEDYYKAFEMHQPLRTSFWYHQQQGDMSGFWTRCAQLLTKPERRIIHEWEKSVRDDDKIIWKQKEPYTLDLSLHKPWTARRADRMPHYAGAKAGWQKILTDIRNDSNAFLNVPLKLTVSNAFIKAAAAENEDIIRYLSDAKKDDFELMNNLCQRSFWLALPHISERLCNSYRFMAPFLEHNPVFVMQHAGDDLRASKAFIREALAYNDMTFEYAAPALKRDTAFLCELADKGYSLLEFVPPDCPDYEQIALAFIQKNPLMFADMDSQWRKKADFIGRLMDEVPGVYSFLPLDMQQRPAFLEKALNFDVRMIREVPPDTPDYDKYLQMAIERDVRCATFMEIADPDIALHALAQFKRQYADKPNMIPLEKIYHSFSEELQASPLIGLAALKAGLSPAGLPQTLRHDPAFWDIFKEDEPALYGRLPEAPTYHSIARRVAKGQGAQNIRPNPP